MDNKTLGKDIYRLASQLDKTSNPNPIFDRQALINRLVSIAGYTSDFEGSDAALMAAIEEVGEGLISEYDKFVNTIYRDVRHVLQQKR